MGAAETFILTILALVVGYVIIAVRKSDDDIETISQATWRALESRSKLMPWIILAIGTVLGHLFW